MNNALEKAVEKIYETIAATGEITDNQLFLIALYERKSKPNQLDEILKGGVKVIGTIDKIMGGK